MPHDMITAGKKAPQVEFLSSVLPILWRCRTQFAWLTPGLLNIDGWSKVVYRFSKGRPIAFQRFVHISDKNPTRSYKIKVAPWKKKKTLIQPKFARPPPEAVSPLPGTSAKALLHNFSAMGVSTSGGTPKWLVYTGKSHLNDLKWMITRGPYFRKPPHVEVSKNGDTHFWLDGFSTCLEWSYWKATPIPHVNPHVYTVISPEFLVPLLYILRKFPEIGNIP